jgi:hypothetical protein
MKNVIWEELTEEELYNAVLEDHSKHVKTEVDFIMWAEKIVENLCLMMSKVTSFITYLNPKKTPNLLLSEKDYDLRTINKVWQGEAKLLLKKLWN